MSSSNGSLDREGGKSHSAAEQGLQLMQVPRKVSRCDLPASEEVTDSASGLGPGNAWMPITQGEGLSDIVEEGFEYISMVGGNVKPRASGFLDASAQTENQDPSWTERNHRDGRIPRVPLDTQLNSERATGTTISVLGEMLRGSSGRRISGHVPSPRSGIIPVVGQSEYVLGTSGSPSHTPARSSASSAYMSTRSSLSPAYVSVGSNASSAYASARSGVSPAYGLTAVMNSAVSDLRAARTKEPSDLYSVSKKFQGIESDSTLLLRIRNVSILREDDFASCEEPWALGCLYTWLQGVFLAESNFAYEELVMALTILYFYKSLVSDTSEALQYGSAVAWRLRTADPPVFSLMGDDTCRWITPLETPCGVIPALTGGGCYSRRVHVSKANNLPIWSCYSPHCSKGTVRQPDITSRLEGFPGAGASRGLSDWQRLLRAMNLFPPFDTELNWSGRGQHAEFQKTEQIPLRVEKAIGHGTSALVESVMCRRIRLARKSIRCSWRLKREDAIKEVAHLQRAQHAHIVRVVGTYIIEKSRNLHILMYPVAECHLNDFMDDEDIVDRWKILLSFFPCLASTLAFLHDKHHIKHMDIKPGNILVRDIRNTKVKHHSHPYKVYLADFGISRSYASIEDSETNSVTSFTPLYAAPEVVSQDTRGFKADVFSLGCVFAEVMAAIHFRRDELADIREQSGCRPFHANIPVVQVFLYGLVHDSTHFLHVLAIQCICTMISEYPDDRPSAADVRDYLKDGELICDDEIPEAFEAARPLSKC